MFFHKTPSLVIKLFRGIIWHQSRTEKNIYLTFDDGPVPEVTEYILDILSEHKIKATFFCVGENVVKNQDIFLAISVFLILLLSSVPSPYR